jgi:hypothetical protein
MKVIEVKEILVEDDVYAALEREAKELSISAAKCAPSFEVTISHVVDMAVRAYGQRVIEEQKKADALAYTE